MRMEKSPKGKWRPLLQNALYAKSWKSRFWSQLEADGNSECASILFIVISRFILSKGTNTALFCKTRYMPGPFSCKARYVHRGRMAPAPYLAVVMFCLLPRVLVSIEVPFQDRCGRMTFSSVGCWNGERSFRWHEWACNSLWSRPWTERGKKEYPRETPKRLRHSATNKVPSISCQHDSKFCQATQLTTEDLTANHQRSASQERNGFALWSLSEHLWNIFVSISSFTS